MNKAAKDNKQQNAQPGQKGEMRAPGTSILEWVVPGVSCLLLIAVLAYLTVVGVVGDQGTPPELVVEPIAVSATGGGFVVEFSASNRSRESVSAVEIGGELRNHDEVVEEASANLDYIPQHSKRRGALIFRKAPNQHQMHLMARGYAEP